MFYIFYQAAEACDVFMLFLKELGWCLEPHVHITLVRQQVDSFRSLLKANLTNPDIFKFFNSNNYSHEYVVFKSIGMMSVATSFIHVHIT